MAGIKIVNLPALGRNLASTDLFELSLAGGTGSRKITGQEIINGIPLPPSGLNIGTTAITSGTVGRVLFEGTGNVVSESANLFFDSTNNRLGINTSTPTNPLSVYRSGSTNYFNFEPSATGTAPYIQALWAGAFDLRFNLRSTITVGGLSLDSGLTLFNQTSSSNASLVVGLLGTTGNASVAGGKLQLGGTTDNMLYFQQSGAAARGLVGYASGQSYMQVRVNGATDFTNGTFSTAFFSTGNIGINTTTDAGFKLDVNGTARITGNTTLNNYFVDSTGFLTYTSGANPLFIQTGGGGGSIILRPGTNTGLTVAAASTQVGNHTSFSNGALDILVNANYIFRHSTSGNSFDFRDGVRVFIKATNSGTLIQNTSFSGTAINASALLEVQSTTLGFLPPRMTTTQRNAIATPATGLEVFDSTTLTPSIYNGTNWQNVLVPTSNGNVLINTTTDLGYKLDVNGGSIYRDSLTNTIGGFVHKSTSTSNDAFWSLVSGSVYFVVSAGGYCKTTSNLVTAATGAGTINASAISQIDSTTKGFLPPRMTQAQRNAIASPAIGLEIYQTDATEGKYIYKSSGWTYIG